MGAKSLWDSFKYAGQGIAYSFRTSAISSIHCLAALLLVVLLLVFDFAVWEVLFLLAAPLLC